jgi:CheY-like chemotaxis protein
MASRRAWGKSQTHRTNQQRPETAVFASLSGFRMDTDLRQNTAAGFSRHLVKSIDMATLRATLAEMTSRA